MDHEAGGLAAVDAALGGDDVLLVVKGAADDEDTVLENGRGVSEDEVDGAGDDAGAVELPMGLRVERVLVALHAAVEEDGAVRLHPQGHGLVLYCASRVAEAHGDGDEPVSHGD